MVAAVALAVCACGGPGTEPALPAAGVALAQPVSPPAVTQAPTASPAAVALPDNAPGVLYVCVTGDGPRGRRTAIELPPQVAQVCRKAPEMGPCRFERDACRRGGGRVFAANGAEITLATEAEYDKHVLRVRMRAD
jgi:hypothetical protein